MPDPICSLIANEAKVSTAVIGAIEIKERFSIVDVPVDMAKGILEARSAGPVSKDGRSHCVSSGINGVKAIARLCGFMCDRFLDSQPLASFDSTGVRSAILPHL